MTQNTSRIFKGVWSLIFTLVIMLLVVQKINSINELTTTGWLVFFITFIALLFFTLKMADLIQPHVKLKEDTLQWLLIFLCFSIFGLMAYMLSNDKINTILFKNYKITHKIELLEKTYHTQYKHYAHLKAYSHNQMLWLYRLEKRCRKYEKNNELTIDNAKDNLDLPCYLNMLEQRIIDNDEFAQSISEHKNTINQPRSPALIEAYNNNDFNRFRKLAENKADLNIKSGSHSILTRSIIDKKYNYTYELINNGADVNQFTKKLTLQQSDKMYKLRDVENMSAKMEENLNTQRTKIQDSADNYHSYPAIYYAIKQNAIAVVKHLLTHHADISHLKQMKVDDMTILDYAEKQHFNEISALITQQNKM